MGKLIRAVLRGRNGGNTVLLPDKYEQDGVARKLYGLYVRYNQVHPFWDRDTTSPSRICVIHYRQIRTFIP